MDSAVDNLVWILSVLWLVVVALAFLYAVLAALGLWRSLKAARARIEPVMAEVSASADLAQQGAAGLEARQRDLGDAGDELQAQVNSAIVAGRHAGEVAQALRFPVRFLTGL